MGIATLAGPLAANRLRMSGAHLALTAAVAGALFALLHGVWYPLGLFDSGRGAQLLMLTAGVSVAIGPLLTLIVYAPGKRGLDADLATILVLQALALGYGLYVMHASRPVYVVLVEDRFELVRANEVLDEGRDGERAAALPLDGPSVVGSRLPLDPRERDRLVDAAIAGIDLHHFPQHFVPYDTVRGSAARAAQPIEALRRMNPSQGGRIDAWVAGTGRAEPALRFLPLRDGGRELAAIVDAADAEVLRIVPLAPWDR